MPSEAALVLLIGVAIGIGIAAVVDMWNRRV